MNNVSGNIRVTGEIETHVPPKLAEERKAFEQRKDTRDSYRFVVEIVTAFLLAIYAGVTILMYCANMKAAKAAEDAANAAKSANTINRAATTIANRAWLTVTRNPPFPTLEKIDYLVFPWEIENTGKTPTGPVSIDVVVEIVNSGEEPSFNYSQGHVLQMFGTVFPNKALPFQAILFKSDQTPARLSPEDRKKLSKGKAYLATFGKINYSDSFGPHWTQFCEWDHFATPISVNALDCANYNKVDIE
ncbi:MAG TPA: hypothetical protein VMT38_04380 [Terracidiphilus sp.]|nr:hypothetical protein [Terracidiphilus sp.]